ncbi:MAG: DnaJ-class molecular chaperone CbpA [uncultured Thiotrichaceae bacterium]|uniref:DnaJ-class molecular chaperone CbpA n=1 Tax=uncultured Thiotrichaceae bacterium TaxID=298394 RepID=A0A6S6SLF7_9GAMM|nr:MAG: DnaJ-class molecular chaperone CbpA [uncultured Thiotrichaceae bacterium]
MQQKDYYKTLDLKKSASADDIKKAYRRLARKYHPDVSKEANAEERFKEVYEAYDVLNDKKKRGEYDDMRSGRGSKNGAGFQPPPGWQSGNFDANFFEDIMRHDNSPHSGSNHGHGAGNTDFFDNIFGGQTRNRASQAGQATPQVATVPLTLGDIYHGSQRKIRLPDGRNIQVKIPKGIEEGQKIRISNGPGRAEIHLKVKLQPHKHFKVDGKNILLELPIAPWEAALGSMITVPTLEGNVNLRIPEAVQTGKKMRLQGRGLPGDKPGDQIVTLVIMTPPAKQSDERDFYREMEKTFNWDPRKGMLN